LKKMYSMTITGAKEYNSSPKYDQSGKDRRSGKKHIYAKYLPANNNLKLDISSSNDDMISTSPSSMNMPSGESPDFKEDIERNMINEVVEDINSTIANLEKPSSLKLMSPSHSMSASPSPAPLKIVLSPEGKKENNHKSMSMSMSKSPKYRKINNLKVDHQKQQSSFNTHLGKVQVVEAAMMDDVIMEMETDYDI